MSVDPTDPRSVADVLFESIAKPIRGASLFYALYYLTEIEGVDRAAFDFQQIRDEYREAFWWYGIFTIAKEVSHVWDKYYVDGFKTHQYFNRQEAVIVTEPEVWTEHNIDTLGDEAVTAHAIEPPTVGMMPPEPGTAQITLEPRTAREHARGLVSPANGDMAVDVFERAGQLSSPPFGRSVRQVNAFLEILEKQLTALTEPEPFIEAVGEIFQNTVPFGVELGELVNELPEAARELPEPVLAESAQRVLLRASGWASSDWNGPGWAGIPKHLLRRDGLSPTAWVDQCWAIEHNNQNWMDKLDPAERDRRVVAEEVPDVGQNLAPQTEVIDALADVILNAARDGDIGRVFDFAVHWDDEVGVSLRRWRARLGV